MRDLGTMRDALGKLGKLLTSKQKRLACIAFALMVLAALFEFLSAMLFLPFVAILTDPSIVDANPYLRSLKAMTGMADIMSLKILIGLTVVIVICTSMLIRALNVYAINRFCFSVLHALTVDMMRLHLARDYSFYLDRNTADLTKTVLIEAEKLVRDVLFPLMRIVLHGVIALFLTTLLFVISPAVALATSLVLAACIYGISLAFRGATLSAGQELYRANTERFRRVSETFGGVKELRMLGREGDQLDRLGVASMRYATATARSETLALMPTFLVQAVAISAGVGALVYAVWLYGFGAALPSIAAFAYGAYRLMPSLQAFALEISVVRYSLPALNAFYSDYETAKLAKREEISVPAEPVRLTERIEIKDLSFRYDGQARTILSDVALHIHRGERIGIVGSSGSGKSTLIDLIVGLLKPTAGRILIDGQCLDALGARGWRQCLGYVPQTIFLADDSVSANIAFGVPSAEIDQAAVEEAAARAQLHQFVTEELEAGYATFVGERGIRLSGGQRQRIGIARALYRKPDVLVFDEATSSLDNETEASVMASIDELGSHVTLITVAHRLSTMKPFTRIYVMDEGRIVGTGSYGYLAQHNSKFQDLLSQRPEPDLGRGTLLSSYER